MRLWRCLAGFLALVFVTAACGTPNDPELAELRAQLESLRQQEQEAKVELAKIEDEGLAAAEEEPEGSTDPDEVAADSSKLNIPFYYDNFKVTLGTAKVFPETDLAGAHLLIDIECENLIDDQAYCPGAVKVESNREFYTSSGSDTPYIPGRLTGVGSYRFSIDEKFRLADAVLLVGDSPRHIATIPLCPDKDAAAPVLLEPINRPLGGTVTAGGVTVTLTGMQLRADGPRHTTRDADKLTLMLTMDLRVKKSERGAYYLTRSSFEVKRPDGNTSEAEVWSATEEYVDNDMNEKGVTIFFEIDNPPAGSYTLEATGRDDEGADVTSPLAFSISE